MAEDDSFQGGTNFGSPNILNDSFNSVSTSCIKQETWKREWKSKLNTCG